MLYFARVIVLLSFGITVLAAEQIENPYADVDWEKVEYLHSFSHQHGGRRDLQMFVDMGFRHLPFSGYYPSKPCYPLPASFLKTHPEVIGCPNAEQHSCTDLGLHFNVIGSYYTTGYGSSDKTTKGEDPFGTVDMLFSQPVMIKK